MHLNSRIIRKSLAAMPLMLACLAGCNSDVDPQAKVDAPGYYNGPMKPKGNGGPAGAESPAPAATAGATTG